MNKDKLKEIFEKHYKSVGSYLCAKLLENKKKNVNNDASFAPLPDWMRVIGTFVTTLNIRYGDYIEEIINLFLEENGAILLKNKEIINITSKELKKYDLFFELNGTIYIGEIKIRDNHDSTKKVGQINNLIAKVEKIKNNTNKKISAILFFLDSSIKKNKSFYEKELLKNINIEKFSVLYGDEFFEKFKLSVEWNELKKLIISYNDDIKNNNEIYEIAYRNLKKEEKEEFNKIKNILIKKKAE